MGCVTHRFANIGFEGIPMTYLYEETVLFQTLADEDVPIHAIESDELEDFSWGADPADILAAKQESEL